MLGMDEFFPLAAVADYRAEDQDGAGPGSRTQRFPGYEPSEPPMLHVRQEDSTRLGDDLVIPASNLGSEPLAARAAGSLLPPSPVGPSPVGEGSVLHSGPPAPTEGRIRSAVPRDVPALLAMARAFVEEGRTDMVWGPRTEAVYLGLFEGLAAGTTAGALVLAPGKGFACAAESAFDTPFGRAAHGFGIYVRPWARGGGLGRALHGRLLETLAAAGFAALITGADSPAGAAVLAGIEPLSTYGLIRITRGG